MPNEPPALLDRVADILETRHIPYALIGAAALAIHGISRSTFDIDLFVTDTTTLDPDMWTLLPQGILVDIRRGDAADPLAGVVRLRAPGQRDVDIVVGRRGWQSDLLSRVVMTTRAGRQTPIVRPADLILLKLYAGGLQDRWDVEQLLALPNGTEIAADVDREIQRLPVAAQTLWVQLRSAQ